MHGRRIVAPDTGSLTKAALRLWFTGKRRSAVFERAGWFSFGIKAGINRG